MGQENSKDSPGTATPGPGQPGWSRKNNEERTGTAAIPGSNASTRGGKTGPGTSGASNSNNTKNSNSAFPADGAGSDEHDDESLLNSNNPLGTASVVDSSRNRFVMFMSSCPNNSLSMSDLMSRASLNSSKYSVGSKGSALSGLKSIRSGVPGTQPGDVVTPNTTPLASASGSTTGSIAPMSPTTSNNNNMSNNNSDAGGVGIGGGTGSGQASPVTGALASQLSSGKGVQQLPPFGFTSPIGISGWNNLTEASLEEEIEEFLPSEVLARMIKEEEAHPQAHYANQHRRSPSVSSVNEANGDGMTKQTSSTSSSKFSTSRANSSRNRPNQMQVAVLSTPRQTVLSALQPLASSPSSSANMDAQQTTTSSYAAFGQTASYNNNNNEDNNNSNMVHPQPGDTGSVAAPFSAEIKKRMEAASRIRYAVPTNYTMSCVGSQPRPIRCVCSTGDGGQYLIIAMEGNTARLIEPGQPVGSSLLDFRGMMDELIASAVSRDGRYVVLSAKDGAVTSWDLTNGKKVRDLSVTTPIRAIALSDDGELVAGTTGEDSIAVWETKSGDTLSNCSIHSSTPTAVTISRRGNLAASGTVGGEVCVWQCPSGSVTFRFTANTKPIRSLSFSADGSRLMAVDSESLRIWDTFTGELVVSRYTDDSISLGEEEPIPVSNGSFSQSSVQQRRKNRIQSVSTQSANRGSINGSHAAIEGGSNEDGGGSGDGLTGARLKHLDGSMNGSGNDDDRNTAPPTTTNNSRGPRTGPMDPMEQIFEKNSSASFTCGSFAACNIAVVGTNTGLMMMMEPNTGTELLSLSCRSAVRSLSAAWQGDVLYLGDNSGNVYKLKLSFSSRAIQDFNVGLKTNNGRDNKRANMD